MLKSDYSGQNCSIARALEAVGERWTLLIVRELLIGPRRFGQLEQRLGIAKNVLTQRLEKLVALGIATKGAGPDAPHRSPYALTEKGADLYPVVSALMAWGDTHDAPDGPPVLVEHGCGHAAGQRLVCRACGGEMTASSVRPLPGPGFVPHDAAG